MFDRAGYTGNYFLVHRLRLSEYRVSSLGVFHLFLLSLIKIIGVAAFTFISGADTALAIQKTDPHRSQRVSQESHHKEPSRDYFCGVNSLYILLRLLDKEVSYESVLSVIPPDPQGHSILQLHEAAACFDQDSVICQSTLTRLRKTKTPVIILFKPRKQQQIGHFVVMTHYADRRYHTIDPTTSLPYDYTEGQMERLWTGYALIPVTSYYRPTDLLYLFPLLTLFLVCFRPIQHLVISKKK
ncbi:cysteine peptidase family C39 domain-containing protein [Gimesia panareensis]|uniref:cysteine peptidase family C39 domain-containing protein n=1 Tax=Gimesia panareensis TaxID=2527978 RepID=UPI0018D83CD5|nr:cysteine peptidase family C39 domain-containing protein [Gimesia panareensis]